MSLFMSQAAITKPCNGVIHEMSCDLFVYAAPGATRRNWNEKSKSSSNVTNAKGLERHSHPITPLLLLH